LFVNYIPYFHFFFLPSKKSTNGEASFSPQYNIKSPNSPRKTHNAQNRLNNQREKRNVNGWEEKIVVEEAEDGSIEVEVFVEIIIISIQVEQTYFACFIHGGYCF
jgi:hypothetical protein